jgi:4-amino-4-deoxy-L-arabinose transferase-like glycosyltransferase
MLTANTAPEAVLIQAAKTTGTSERRKLITFAAIFMLACWVFFSALGSFPLFNPDEALYAEPAREMLETHDYLTTTFNYAVRFTKPPLCIWAMALTYQVLGVNEFAARFFGAACGAILTAVTYGFLSRYVSNTAAIIGALTLLMSPLFVATGREAITDMPLSLFIAGAMFSFYRGFREKQMPFVWLGYVLVGLSVMTKGPVGLVLPAAVLFVYHAVQRNLIQAFKTYKPLIGAVIVGAISLPWFITEIVATNGAYFREFILRENVQRYTSVVDKHKGGWYYHAVAMFGGFLPWTVFLPQSIVALFKKKDTNEVRDLGIFALCFAGVTLVFFSASVSKLIPYTVPAFPALAVLVAIEIDRIINARSPIRLLIPFSLLAIAFGGASLAAEPIFAKIRRVPAGMFTVFSGYLNFQSIVMLISVALAAFKKPQMALACFTVFSIACSAFFGYNALQLLSEQWEGPVPGLSRFAGESGDPIFVYQARIPSVPFYAHRATILSPNQEGITTTVEKELPNFPRACIIAKAGDGKKLLETTPGCKLLRQEGNYMLIQWIRR